MVKNALKQTAYAIISLAIIFYILLQLMLSVGDTVETENAVLQQADLKVELTAYLFRDETVLDSGSFGTNSYLVEDGEKVLKGNEVCVTYSEAADADAQEKIKALKQRIEVLEKSGVGNGYTVSDHKIIDSNISSLVLDVVKGVQSGNYDTAIRTGNDLLIQENRRYALTQTVRDYSMQISACKSEIARLEASFTGEKHTTAATDDGYYYSNVDGYENIFTASAVNTLTLDNFDKIVSSAPDTELVSRSAGKIATTAYWYIACKTTRSEFGLYTAGSNYTLSFPFSSDIKCQMKLSKVIAQTDTDEIVLIFSTKTIPTSLNFSRKQTVNVVKESYSGLRVSASAVRVLDGVRGVYVLDGNTVIFKKIEVLYDDNGTYLCALPDKDNKAYVSASQLSLYDMIIVSGTDLYVGKVLS
ncbi:MAG: hypothetical protein J6A85_02470 [Clostridia bacterium]|nr:hypothetical protein [Clostridia bacterium]